MDNTEITHYTFEKDLSKFATYCATVKPATARKRAEELAEQYKALMHYSLKTKQQQEDNVSAMYILRSGRITYKSKGKDCYLKLEHIESYDYDDKTITIETIAGRSHTFPRENFNSLLIALGATRY